MLAPRVKASEGWRAPVLFIVCRGGGGPKAPPAPSVPCAYVRRRGPLGDSSSDRDLSGVCVYFKHGTVHALQFTVKLNMESGRKVALIIHLVVPAAVAKTETCGVVPGVQVETNFSNKVK